MHARRSQGIALIITLAMLVLVTFAVVAFFTKATFNRNIENSSVGGVRADILARSSMEAIVGELQKEMLANSDAATVTPDKYSNYVMRPKTLQDAVPQVVLSSAIDTSTTDTFNNLVKQSVSTKPFYSDAASTSTLKAAAVKTTQPSLDGRLVSIKRWSSPMLIGGAGGISGFDSNDQAPEWVPVTRSGINGAVTIGNAKNPQSADYVVGRFAYNIYNEGGLLDINAAGYPAAVAKSAADLKILKGTLAGADMTALLSDGTITQAAVDKLIEWRNGAGISNYQSQAPTTLEGYTKLVTQYSGTTGFMQRWSDGTLSSSDQRFISRQDLIRYIQDSGKSDLPKEVLPYLTTFSRSLNQPSYFPDPNRNKVTGVASNTAGAYTGGNNAYGLDDTFNPALRKITVTGTAGLRNDGSSWVLGEPLVKKRFSLNRLAWLTPIGPIANDSNKLNPSGDARLATAISTLEDTYAYREDFLKQGTADNIYKYFGLRWTAGPGMNGLGGHWTYQHGITTSIGTLDQVAAANREPDFFEMLKTEISAGSMGKAWRGTGQTDWRVKADCNVNFQILQIGANIIDQSDLDDFPTQIVFLDNTGVNNPFWGNENLPYLSMIAVVGIVVSDASPLPPDKGIPVAPPVTIADPGKGAALYVPFVWNPYSSASKTISSLSPPHLRIAISTVPRDNSAIVPTLFEAARYEYNALTSSTSNTTGTAVVTTSTSNSYSNNTAVPVNWNFGSYDSATGTVKYPGGGSNTNLYFDNGTSLYRDPTPLLRPNIPSGSNLSIDDKNVLVTNGLYSKSGIVEAGTGQKFLGFFAANYPLRWQGTITGGSSASGIPNGTAVTFTVNKTLYTGNNYPATCSLEYQDPGSGTWIAYQQFKTNNPIGMTQGVYYSTPGTLSSKAALDFFGHFGGGLTWDPRSTRWSMITDAWVSKGGYRPGAPDLTAFLDPDRTICESVRPFAENVTISHGSESNAAGWYGAGFYAGSVCQNISGATHYYKDGDGIVRRGMAGYVTDFNEPANGLFNPKSGLSTVGLPLAEVYSGPGPYSAAGTYNGADNMQNRPVMLNRPFLSVTELGYVNRDTPWKNLDFFMPESGDSALLDGFCVGEDANPSGVVAGKVDLNTRQAMVIKAILAKAYRDEAGGLTVLDGATEGAPLAKALVNRTATKPLSNLADLVGRYEAGFSNANKQPYDGFSADLGIYTGAPGNNIIQRFRETAMRALSSNGMVGTWNLMIDVVAQTGRYPASASNLSNFMVEGEQRYWIHVAIDRQSGKIIDQQIEQVSE